MHPDCTDETIRSAEEAPHADSDMEQHQDQAEDRA